ncbi:MAG: aminotransferase class I/II-fold pyridoxal phosphate-dependent enzyme, partial [Defluviitaleaceae bacterium]|nr:aminotransferase class I/II-fold pyridoxal phosphate-dependent enzyme [Defluviitaleaceae bacterium]
MDNVANGLIGEYKKYKAMGLNLDMSRGRPDAAQLSLSDGLLDCLRPGLHTTSGGADGRNYGNNDGLPEMKKIFSDMLGTSPREIIVGGNSSLNMMFDCAATFLYKIWERPIKFICPVPGYDRHHNICDYLGIEMVPVDMTQSGPDMDETERAAASDARVAGIWCVPVFSNPTGRVYSRETVRRLAKMKAANENFRIFWDNAYCVHNFRGELPAAANIFDECARAGNPERPVVFTSFSKISFAGAGVACAAASEKNLALLRERVAAQTVGPDKLNQLRHVIFFGSFDGVLCHMRKHAGLLGPKFNSV